MMEHHVSLSSNKILKKYQATYFCLFVLLGFFFLILVFSKKVLVKNSLSADCFLLNPLKM